MAGAADVGTVPAGLERLEGTGPDLAGRVALGYAHAVVARLHKRVVEPLAREVALLIGHPLVQPPVRHDPESHRTLLRPSTHASIYRIASRIARGRTGRALVCRSSPVLKPSGPRASRAEPGRCGRANRRE